jgi:acyl-CoA synthetase (AMP-forming)/AMP-acid ligase II
VTPLPVEHLLNRLGRRAVERGEDPAIRFAENGPGEMTVLTWRQLDTLARRARAGLEGLGLGRGDRILLQVPTGPDYLGLLLGAFMAGIVPSTLHAVADGGESAGPRRELSELFAALKPHLIVVAGGQLATTLPVVSPERILAADPSHAASEPVPPEAPAYIQFTSGSTGRPRGIALTWPAIHANLTAIAECAPITARDRLVSWLPMYHDMGLFGALLTTLYVGAGVTLADPRHFVNSPLLWFRLIEAADATLTVGPPSALQTCIQMVARRPFNCDLSSLEQIICGAEPLSERFVGAVADTLSRFGLRLTALRPVYGLAEATLAVSFPPEPRTPRIDRVERGEFETRGIAVPAKAESVETRVWVSAGAPITGTSVRIADEGGAPLSERRVGRVLIRTPSLFAGYIEHGEFEPRGGEWFDTGDLGYIAEGELYITGRRKDLIIKNGRNYAPDRIEELACLVDGVRRAAAFGVYDEERATEKVVILAEARQRELADAAGRDMLRMRIRRELSQAGYLVDVVSLVDRGTLPRTTSGKLRRQLCRELFGRQALLAS